MNLQKINHQSTEWTDDEVAALPQTTQVFEAPKLVIKDHKWQQQGYHISDVCVPSRPDCPAAGLPIPPGSFLSKDEKGAYVLRDEITKKQL